MDKIFQAVMRQSVKIVLNSNGSGFSERRDVYIFKRVSRKRGGWTLGHRGRSALLPSEQRKFRIVIPSFFKRGGIVYKKQVLLGRDWKSLYFREQEPALCHIELPFCFHLSQFLCKFFYRNSIFNLNLFPLFIHENLFPTCIALPLGNSDCVVQSRISAQKWGTA